jgi:hypothetical protein
VNAWLASLLPERTRQKVAPGQGRGPTLWTALIQMAAGVTLGVTGFIVFRGEYYRRTVAAGFAGGDLDQMFGYGAVLYLSYLVTLRGLAAAYLFVEGGVRALSAIYVEEPCPSLVVSAVDALVRRWRGRRRTPPQADVVTVTEGGLVLETDRRRDWDARTTVDHDGVYYAVREVAAIGPERWRYTLGPIPERHLIRGVRTISS